MNQEKESDIESHDTPDRAFVGTDAGRFRQFRETAKPGAANNYSWSAEIGIPKPIWLVYMSLADNRRNTGKLTLEELDTHPDTKHLSKSIKKAVVRHWHRYVEIKEEAYQTREYRANVVDAIVEVDANAKALAKSKGITKAKTAHEQYDLLSRAAADKSQEAQLRAYSISLKVREEDPLMKALHDEAMKDAFAYGKLWKLNKDISDRFASTSDSGIQGVSIDSETAKKMAAVREMLAQRGADMLDGEE